MNGAKKFRFSLTGTYIVMITLGAVFTALLLSLHILTAAGERPKVIFISIDDLNDWTSYLGGHPNGKTPNIDKLAASGVAFEHAYCTAPTCDAFRAALMTGIAPHTSGVYHNEHEKPFFIAEGISRPHRGRAVVEPRLAPR